MEKGGRIYYQIDVTQFVEPEVIDGRGDPREIVGLESGLALDHGGTEAGQDPAVRNILLATQLREKQTVGIRMIQKALLIIFT